MVQYDFYVSDYLGTAIPESAFNSLAVQAQGVLNRFKRTYYVELPSDANAENMALCAMAEALYRKSQEDAESGIASQSIGSVRVSYTQLAPQERRRRWSRELYDAASQYLNIYRGVGR